MWRVLAEPLALFLSPFAAYALFVVLTAGDKPAPAAWSRRHVSWLTLAGLTLALASMLALGAMAPRGHGAYTPAHIENGQLVPGHMD